jgi:hypothetical protein
MSNEPHASGWRAHLDLAHAAPRCGAKRRDGGACKSPAVTNRLRCRMHGGLSTGPRTPEGLERSRKARWQHGLHSADAKAARAEGRQAVRYLREIAATMRVAEFMELLNEVEGRGRRDRS